MILCALKKVNPLDKFQTVGKQTGPPTLGYTVIFVLAAANLIAGTVLVRRVRKACKLVNLPGGSGFLAA